MPHTKLHKVLGRMAGGAAKTGQNSAALIAKIDQLEKTIKDGGLIKRLDTLLTRLESVLPSEDKKKRGSGLE